MNAKTLFAAAALALTAGAASAGGNVTVDALAQCLDFGTGTTPGFVYVNLAPGQYKASVVSSTTVFNQQRPDEITSTVAVIQDLAVVGAISLTKSMSLSVTDGGSVDIRLFITDSVCADNSGSTIVKFKKVG
jgi:hypothetical protein